MPYQGCGKLGARWSWRRYLLHIGYSRCHQRRTLFAKLNCVLRPSTATYHQGSRLPSVSTHPRRGTWVSSNSVTAMTPGASSSTTSTTTVSATRPSDFTRCRFFCGAFLTALFGLALATLRFVPPLGADFDALRAPARAAEVLPRIFPRFFDCALARFFRLAMIDLLPAAVYCSRLKSVCAASGSIK